MHHALEDGLVTGPAVSVVIPAYNRVELLRHTLRSALRAAEHTEAEIIVVDDGSTTPIEEQLRSEFSDPRLRFLRQHNQGSIVARCLGLMHARGRYVLFLDSDDLIAPEKLIRHVELMDREGVEISYSDSCSISVSENDTDFGAKPIKLHKPRPGITHPSDFALRVQVTPHCPVYRRDYITAALITGPAVPPRRFYDAVGDNWIYFNIILRPARIAYIPEPLAIVVNHEADRYTARWEKLSMASQLLVTDFARACPRTPETHSIRQMLYINVLAALSMLPTGFPGPSVDDMLGLIDTLPQPPLQKAREMGGQKFALLVRFLGFKRAALIRRRMTRPRYEAIRTLSSEELNSLLTGYTENLGTWQEAPTQRRRRAKAGLATR